MTLEEIRQLIELVQESSIAELEITRGDDRIRIVRQHQQTTVVSAPATSPPVAAVPPANAPSPPTASAPTEAPPETPSDNLHEITAPMVGTFYRAPAPGAPPYIEVGDHIEEGQIICIIEAMKLMNEIPADRAGTVVEIAVENAQPVEYGQVLVRIRPD